MKLFQKKNPKNEENGESNINERNSAEHLFIEMRDHRLYLIETLTRYHLSF